MEDIVYVHVPPAGIEPAHPPPEGGALSPELWGLKDIPRLPALNQRVWETFQPSKGSSLDLEHYWCWHCGLQTKHISHK